MLQIPTPGSEGPEKRAGWHHLTEMFSASLRSLSSTKGRWISQLCKRR